ncbi:lipopolysaccharide biosynthesis protein [Ferrimonas senticii]|uniref:lipopolysaccharide biosynthesis protein n=1 Tax=Ferrimonas senticii TaxID=394566 RepID=UPI00041F7AB9|nr:oligosaccharide flippase family protein [Ferrimonas senticii]
MSIFRSIISLSALKAVDFLVPLSLIPIAINNIGISNFGKVAYFQSIALFCATVVDFGFNVGGIQKVAVTSDEVKINRYYSASLIIKFTLCLIVLPIYFTIAILSPYYSKEFLPVVLICFFVAIGSVFNSQWFYQAKHRYRFLMLSSLPARVLALLSVFFMVKGNDDYVIYSLIVSVMYLIPGIIHFAERSIIGSLVTPKYKYVKMVLFLNFDIFVYRIGSAIILPFYNYLFGFGLTPSAFGALSLVQKFLGAIVNFSSPICQAVIPYFAKLKKQNITQYNKSFITTLVALVIYAILITFLSVLCLQWLVNIGIIGGEIEQDELHYAMVFLGSLIPHILNALLSQNLVLNGNGKAVRQSVLISLTITVAAAIILVFSMPSALIIAYVISYYVMLFLFLKKTIGKNHVA